MAKLGKIVLKPGKEKPVRHRHPWIFSGAIAEIPSFIDGDFLPVYASDGKFLGSGYFNRSSSILGRMVSFDETPPLESIAKKLASAKDLREGLFDLSQTNAYRLVNGEGDGIPGLIIDVYDKVVVLQSSTLGIDRIKLWIVDWINKNLSPASIYEKSLVASRREEGLQEVQGFLSGECDDVITFKENGHLFATSLSTSQKTGFFLDHREMRKWVGALSKGKRVLNAFSYTGGFGIYARAGGAISVDSVDISKDALESAKKNALLNGQEGESLRYYPEDVFLFLRKNELPYDLVILDPPAFAKKKKDVIPGCRGYKDINRLAMQKMPPKSLLLTCSCSYYVSEELFKKVLFQAALEAGREVRIIGRHRLAPDHPISLFHPESDYLKSFLLFIE